MNLYLMEKIDLLEDFLFNINNEKFEKKCFI